MSRLNHFQVILLPIFISIVFSCNNSLKEKDEQQPDLDTPINSEPNKESSTQIISPKNTLPTKGFTEIKFENITILIHKLETGNIFDFDGNETSKDSVEIEYDIPESVEGQFLYVSKSNLTDVKLEFCHENSLSLHMEGPHWDLYDWKHYTSKWKMLRKQNGKYQLPEISRKERTRFPTYSEHDLREYVEWDTLVAQYPDSQIERFVGVSRIYVRITGFLNNKKYSYIAVLYEPMGC